MCFVGYSLTSKGYRLFDETKRKVFVQRDVTFNEKDFGHKETMTTTDKVAEPKQIAKQVVTVKLETEEEEETEETGEKQQLSQE